MKFYHVDNIGKGAKSHWLIAKDETDAIRIASTQTGKPTNLIELPPEENIKDILNGTKTGLLARSIQTMSGLDVINNTFSGKKQKPIVNPWFIYKEI